MSEAGSHCYTGAIILDEDFCLCCGSSGTYQTWNITVEVVDPASTYGATGGSSVNEGTGYTLSLSSTPAQYQDTITSWSVNWADGTSASTLASGSGSLPHTFTDGTYNRTIVATAYGNVYDNPTTLHGYAVEKQVTVNNVTPTATLGNTGTRDENTAATVYFSNVYDPSSTDVAAGHHYTYATSEGGLAG